MKRKYQKMTILITMWIMGIGMLTFSFQPTSVPSADTQRMSEKEAAVVPANSKNAVTASPAPTVTKLPTPTPYQKQDKALKKNTDAKLNQLIQTYYQAKLDTDEVTLSEIISSTSDIDIDALSKVQEYIEGYEDIVCYTKPGLTDNDYVVYVTYNMKITTISTLAPAVDRLYVASIGDQLKLSFGYNEDAINALYAEYGAEEDVQKLIAQNNEKLEQARQNDSDLNDFIRNLTNSLGNKE